jgi:hypothetical protein
LRNVIPKWLWGVGVALQARNSRASSEGIEEGSRKVRVLGLGEWATRLLTERFFRINRLVDMQHDREVEAVTPVLVRASGPGPLQSFIK